MNSSIIRIRPAGTARHLGEAIWREKTYGCAVGKSGIVESHKKREGDSATPAGLFALLALFYRNDRLARPACALPVAALTPDDGWCDAVGDPNYNKPVKHPYRASAEVLWRDDAIYDLIVSTNHNIEPAKSGLGSAIFLHVARDNLTATEGCIAFRKNDLLEILKDVGPKTMIHIEMV